MVIQGKIFAAPGFLDIRISYLKLILCQVTRVIQITFKPASCWLKAMVSFVFKIGIATCMLVCPLSYTLITVES